MIYIAGDKHGYKVITFVKEYLDKNKIEHENLGVKDRNEDLPLQEMLPRVAMQVKKDNNSYGIVCCGTGIGTEIGINKFSGIRAVLADDPEVAKWAKEKDNCNVLCLIGWRINKEKTFKILDSWFNTKYDGSVNRLKMFEEFDKWN